MFSFCTVYEISLILVENRIFFITNMRIFLKFIIISEIFNVLLILSVYDALLLLFFTSTTILY